MKQDTEGCNRSLLIAISQIRKLRDELALCLYYAIYLIRKAIAAKYLVGRSIESCSAAVVLLACRKHGVSRTIPDLVKATGLRRREIYRTYSQMTEKFAGSLPDPVMYIPRVGTDAGITDRDAVKVIHSLNGVEVPVPDCCCRGRTIHARVWVK